MKPLNLNSARPTLKVHESPKSPNKIQTNSTFVYDMHIYIYIHIEEQFKQNMIPVVLLNLAAFFSVHVGGRKDAKGWRGALGTTSRS